MIKVKITVMIDDGVARKLAVYGDDEAVQEAVMKALAAELERMSKTLEEEARSVALALTEWQCCAEAPIGQRCPNMIDVETYGSGVPGCKATCRMHIEERAGKTLSEIIRQRKEFDTVVTHGDLLCDVCGARNARWVAGEGQALCEEHNTRQGLNRWS